MKTLGELQLTPLWVNPGHKVATALYILKGHHVSQIGVIENDQLVGTIGFENVAGQPETAFVRDVFTPLELTFGPESTVRSAAMQMGSENRAYVPVIRGNELLGIVTAATLLKEMSRTWDPLTGLSWSDRLREWGIEKLKEGQELTILFLDLDRFGSYNKRYGHLVGDRVLQKVAKYLQDLTEEPTDVLVRYGGDEFAIGTIRPRQEAEALSAQIQSRLSGFFVEEHEQPVAVTIGIFGGRRTQERENVHYAATLDNLINLASRDCMGQKANSDSPEPQIHLEPLAQVKEVSPSPQPEPAPAPKKPAMKVAQVVADPSAERSVTMVTLLHGDSPVRGVHAKSASNSTVESVVRATLNALERGDPGSNFELREINLHENTGKPHEIEIVIANQKNGKRGPCSGSVPVGENIYLSAAMATVLASHNC